ncbi:hypothetical protein Trydic_g15608, partial [Trypoxylus dichotomus]
FPTLNGGDKKRTTWECVAGTYMKGTRRGRRGNGSPGLAWRGQEEDNVGMDQLGLKWREQEENDVGMGQLIVIGKITYHRPCKEILRGCFQGQLGGADNWENLEERNSGLITREIKKTSTLGWIDWPSLISSLRSCSNHQDLKKIRMK